MITIRIMDIKDYDRIYVNRKRVKGELDISWLQEPFYGVE